MKMELVQDTDERDLNKSEDVSFATGALEGIERR